MNLNIMTAADATRIAQAVKDTAKDATTIATEGQARPPGETPQVTADDLYTQIVKYIPAPLIGFYLLIVNVLVGSIGDADLDDERLWTAVTFGFFAILIVFFLRTRGVRRFSQIAVSVLSFTAWATASPGFFQLISGYEEWIGTIALAVMLVILVTFRVKALPDDVIKDSTP